MKHSPDSETARPPSGGTAGDGLVIEVIRRPEFLSGNYRGAFDDPEGLLDTGPRFEQLVRENPFAADDDPVQLAARYDDRIVGRSNLLAGRIRAGDAIVPVYWGSGLRVSPAFRRRRIAQRLVEHRMGLHHTVGGCGPARTTTSLYRKLNWVEFRLQRRLLLLKSEQVLQRFLGGGFSSVLAPAADLLLGCQRRLFVLRSRRALKGYELERVDALPPSVDAGFRNGRADGSVQSVRSAESINLLLRLGQDCPQRCVLVRRGGKLAGYVIVRALFHETASRYQIRNLTMGTVKDWHSFDAGETNETLLMLVGILELMTMGVDAIEATPALEATGRALRGFGMFSNDSLKLFIHAKDGSALAAAPEWMDPGNWRFTGAEGDNFFL